MSVPTLMALWIAIMSIFIVFTLPNEQRGAWYFSVYAMIFGWVLIFNYGIDEFTTIYHIIK